MQQFSSQGYDRALTVFSPDGRLFQIEYAREAVKRGTTSVGIVSKDGVIFAVDKKVKSKESIKRKLIKKDLGIWKERTFPRRISGSLKIFTKRKKRGFRIIKD